MKRISYILLCFCTLMACKESTFLDNKADTALTENVVFSDSIQTLRFLTRIYEDAGFSFNKSGSYITEHATDDGEPQALQTSTSPSFIMANGLINPTTLNIGYWSLPYQNIRRVNLLLSKLPDAPFSEGMKRRMAGEARFLRAWYYHFLLKYFGGVPILEDRLFAITDQIDLPRNSFSDCVEYLVKELDEAEQMLPKPGIGNAAENYADIDFGRATSGGCQALKSRILLMAASPLFNGGALTTSPDLASIVSYPSYGVDKWQRAADAAQKLITTGMYSLVEDNETRPGNGFYQVFLTRNNPEYIFAYNRAPNREMESYYNPPSRGGSRGTMPTQNLVDAFPMKDGKFPVKNNVAPSIGEPSKYAYSLNPNPYLNLDPRFYFTVIHNGANYFLNSSNNQQPVYSYLNAPTDGYNTTNGPNYTGYYARKFCDENVSGNSSFNTNRGWPLIRYAEVLLNYAEAITEAGKPELAYDAIKMIRKRAGIEPGTDNMYGLKAGMGVAEMRELVRNERRIELAFEDQRWFDLRRWKLGVAHLNGNFNKAMRIVKDGNNYTHEVVNVVSQKIMVFPEKMYLLPIPDSEMRKMPSMKQNPLW
jgi:hypothetical protein